MVTIVVPVSRPEFVDRFFAMLEMLECDSKETNILAYCDGPLSLFQKTRNLVVNSKFRERLCIYRKKGLPNVSNILMRRQRISDIHNEIRDLINEPGYILLTEDDTLIPSNGLKKMLSIMSDHPHAGIVSGIQLGRWGFTYIGAWKADDVYETNDITSVLRGDSVEQVDATGFYCCLVRSDYYQKHLFAPYEKILGPDVNFGIWLRQQGLKNYVDYSLKCIHMTKKENIGFLGQQIIQIKYRRDNEYQFGWEQVVINDLR